MLGVGQLRRIHEREMTLEARPSALVKEGKDLQTAHTTALQALSSM